MTIATVASTRTATGYQPGRVRQTGGMARPRVAVLTREYPPEVYGGAGTHVEYLVREMRRLADVSVHCWGAPRDEPDVVSHQPWAAVAEPRPESAALEAMSIDLTMAA